MPRTPSEIRASIYRTATGPQFRFPKPVAFLLSAVFEPRDDDAEYEEPLVREIAKSKKALRTAMTQIKDDVETLRDAPGKIEKTCLEHLPRLLAAARAHDAGDIARRLVRARRVSRGEAAIPVDRDQIVFAELPEPRTVIEGRPPVGLWR